MGTENKRMTDYENRKKTSSLFADRNKDEEDSLRLKSDTSSTIVSSGGDTFDEIIRRQISESEIPERFQREEEYSLELTEESESENSTWGESYDIYCQKKKIDNRNGKVKFFKDDESLNSLEWIVDKKDGSSTIVSGGEGSLEKLQKLTHLGIIDEGSDCITAETEDGQLIQSPEGNALSRRLRAFYERIQQYEKIEKAVEQDGYDAAQLRNENRYQKDGMVTKSTKIQLVKVQRQQFIMEEKTSPNLVDRLLVLRKREDDSPKSNESSHSVLPSKGGNMISKKNKHKAMENHSPTSIEQLDIEVGKQDISALTPPVTSSPKIGRITHHKNQNQVVVDEGNTIDSSEIPPVQEPQNANISTSFFASFLNSYLFKSRPKNKTRNRIVLSDDATINSRILEYQRLERILIVLVFIAVATLIILIIVFVA